MTIEQLMGSLQVYEEKQKRKIKQKEAMEQLLQLNIKEANYANYKSQRGRGRGQDRERVREHGGEGRGSYNNYSNNGERSWNPQATRGRGRGNAWSRCDKSQIKCFNCNKIGHYAYESRFSKKVVEKTNFVEEKVGEEETLLLACQSQVEEKRNNWYPDTDARNHMCGDRSMFVEINEATTGNVSFGDDSKIPVKGKEEDEMEPPMIEENITPPASPILRLDETSSSERTPRLRSIEELYEVAAWNQTNNKFPFLDSTIKRRMNKDLATYEIKTEVLSMAHWKSPGLGAYPAGFFQNS
ncbi:hypothetical protein KIW84_011871 [Lathyrus oleraceus]|uniref:Retrovirus-related Pol polyprotein from transposon TNT 1-94-like beta-barrel domain-containing protein n=1 Tax=Pisum sativum TaxID=3888 RepID=A0A9D5BG08_PEA|nr:hypothetical protein KIW84_011871 [Pisum sativum]